MSANEPKAERSSVEMTIVSVVPSRVPNPMVALKKLVPIFREEKRRWQGIDPAFSGPLQGLKPYVASPAQEQHQLLCRELLSLLADSDTRPSLVKFSAQQSKEGSARTSPLSGQERLLYRLYKSEGKLVRSILEQAGFVSTNGNDWNCLWAGAAPQMDLFEGLTDQQKINHFPGSTQLTRKDQMYTNVQRLQQLCGKGELDIVPETYLLPTQLQEFSARFAEAKELTWIAKPSASSQGKGIFLVESLDQLPAEPYVVSQYIANPLLINNLKFDMRIYVLVTSYDPLRVYVYKEGLARFASEEYTGLTRKDARYMHLTNYSVNKRNDKYIGNQDYRTDNVGHKWSLSALFAHLETLGVDSEFLWAKICDLVIKAVISVQDVVSDTAKDLGVSAKNCFDLFGFDVLLDSSLKPWLLEVNLSPSLATETSLDLFIKSHLLSDTFNLVGIRTAERRREPVKPRIRFRSSRKGDYSSAPPRSLPPSKPSQTHLTFRHVLRDLLEENERCGHYQRIFPAKGTDYYEKFFIIPQTHTRRIYGVLYEGDKADLPMEIAPPLPSPGNEVASASVSVLHSGPNLRLIKPKNASIAIRKLAPSTEKERGRTSYDKRIHTSIPRENSFSSYSTSTSKGSHMDKIVVTGDDILMEYISRLISALVNTSEEILSSANRRSIESFVAHSVWRNVDPKMQGKSLLWQRLEGRYYEMRVRRMRVTESEARIRGGSKEGGQVEDQRRAVVAGFTSQQLEDMLRASTRNVAREVVLPLLDHLGGGVLSDIQSSLQKSTSSQLRSPDSEEEASDKSPQLSPRSKRRVSLEQLSGPDVLRVSWKLASAKKRPQSMVKSMRG